MKNSEILERIEIFKLLGRLGITGAQTGKELMCRCPFPEHEDKTPSFSIVVAGDKTGLWQCFSCGAKGNLNHLVQRMFDFDRDQADNWLRNECGLGGIIYSPSVKELTDLLEKHEVNEVEEDLIRIPMPKVDDSQERVVDYLVKNRGYKADKAVEIVNAFGMKYVASGYYEGRMITPIHDSTGQQVTFEACDVTGVAEKRKLYPLGSPVGRLLFNQHRVTGGVTWVVEGLFDAIRLWSFGEPVISTFGAKLSQYQSRIIINKYRDVFLMYDGDEAGRRAQEKAMSILSPYLNVFDVPLWYGDPDTLKYQEFREIVRLLRRG